MVSTPLKNISQIRSFPQVGMKINNIWNHHLGFHACWPLLQNIARFCADLPWFCWHKITDKNSDIYVRGSKWITYTKIYPQKSNESILPSITYQVVPWHNQPCVFSCRVCILYLTVPSSFLPSPLAVFNAKNKWSQPELAFANHGVELKMKIRFSTINTFLLHRFCRPPFLLRREKPTPKWIV